MRLLVDAHGAGETPLVGDRPAQQRLDVGRLQRLQRQQQRPRQQRRDHGEVRVLRGGGHQRHQPVLHPGQQRVLLGLGEAVHLVDEQHRLATAARQRRAGGVEHGADVLDPRGDRRDLDEVPPGGQAQQGGDRGLAGAGRAPQQHRHRLVALDQAPQRRSLDQQVVLAHQLVERARPHPHGERAARVGGVGQAAAARRPGSGHGHVEERVTVHGSDPSPVSSPAGGVQQRSRSRASAGSAAPCLHRETDGSPASRREVPLGFPTGPWETWAR